MILDAGFLISVDREESSARTFLTAADRAGTPLRTSEAVVAQVWRNGKRQARLAAFLKTADVHPLDDGRAIGALLRRSDTNDVVDAHLIALAIRLGDNILTGDPDDLGRIATSLEAAAPTIYEWPG